MDVQDAYDLLDRILTPGGVVAHVDPETFARIQAAWRTVNTAMLDDANGVDVDIPNDWIS